MSAPPQVPPQYTSQGQGQYPEAQAQPQPHDERDREKSGQHPTGQPMTAQSYQDQLYAKCAAGNHNVEKKYGLCGIITGILCFPCGLYCLLKDHKEQCTRCGEILVDNTYR